MESEEFSEPERQAPSVDGACFPVRRRIGAVAIDGRDSNAIEIHGVDSLQVLALGLPILHTQAERFLERGGTLSGSGAIPVGLPIRNRFG